MDPITLIITALAAGAAAGAIDGLKDTAKDAATAAYGKLRGLVQRRFAGRPHGELALTEYQTAPQKWEGLLTAELTEAGADKDQELLDAAKALMDLVDRAGAGRGKYNVTISGGQGIQVGDGNSQINTFNNR
jgi:hypothetical protein